MHWCLYMLCFALILSCTACSREEVLASFDAFGRGFTTPHTICSTQYQSHNGNGAYYTACNTY